MTIFTNKRGGVRQLNYSY